jgi:type I restriction enzyme R subunit
VFGDYISVYDIQRAVEDGATVPIYYESRLAKLQLKESERPKLDEEFEEVTEGEELEARRSSRPSGRRSRPGRRRSAARSSSPRTSSSTSRSALEAMDGKAMIVCMSRRICVELYKEIVAKLRRLARRRRRQGRDQGRDDGLGVRPADWQPHIRNKPRREALAKRFKDPTTLKLVIVRDMWLTGFDAPCLHTMYVDKPMQGHGLMQAIARVNRVFKDKPGGLVVDYLGLATS